MGVRLEIFRMVVYLAFPVAIFWVANQPEFFEEYVVKRRKQLYPNDKEQRQKMEDFFKRMKQRREEKILKQVQMASEDSE